MQALGTGGAGNIGLLGSINKLKIYGNFESLNPVSMLEEHFGLLENILTKNFVPFCHLIFCGESSTFNSAQWKN